MQYYKYTLKPTSSFVTYPASDTVFGQLCCMLKLMGKNLDELLQDYDTDPFAVTSCMLLEGKGNAVRIPKKPLSDGEKAAKIKAMKDRKAEKEKNKISIENILNSCIWDNSEIKNFKKIEIVRNSISRISGTTEGEAFSPYPVLETFYDNSAYFHL